MKPEIFYQIAKAGKTQKVCNPATCIDFITPGDILKTVSQTFGLEDGTRALKNFRTIPGLLKG
jgi:hypothetical protein